MKKNIRIAKGCKKIIFSGGEPLVRKDLFEIITYAKKFHKNIGVDTSGIYPYKLIKIVNFGINEVKISFHSLKKKPILKLLKIKSF